MLNESPLWYIYNAALLEGIVEISDSMGLLADLCAMVVAHLPEVPFKDYPCHGASRAKELLL